jgi:putative restriction endonuclease
MDLALEHRVRAALFAHLDRKRALHGGALPYAEIEGFAFEGGYVPAIRPQRGIHKPLLLGPGGAALSVRTAPERVGMPRPYEDEAVPDADYWIYRYQGKDPATAPGVTDNVWVRRAMEHQLPMVYFIGVAKSFYEAVYPVVVTHDDPVNLAFHLSRDPGTTSPQGAQTVEIAVRRAYATREAKVRLHQSRFRELVLGAYAGRCGICRLRHRPLLDAAHIVPDASPSGEASIANGLSLCKIHHAAFDVHIIGISPEGVVRVREDILAEIDGPMLQHGIKEMHGSALHLPRRPELRPSGDRLAERYEQFLKA